MPVAATFAFETIAGSSLSDIARLDTMVTVVDASRYLDRLHRLEELVELGIGADPDDERSVVDLLIDQVEFADVLVVSKPDLVSPSELGQVVALLRRLNPDAEVVIAEHGDVPLDLVLHTGRFDLEKASLAPGWVKALNGEQLPETEQYGVSSFVYRSRWPFHPARLAEALEEEWPGVLRSKGFFWLATRPEVQGLWSQAGLSVQLEPAAYWYAALPEDEWDLDPLDRADLESRWDPLLGDRRIELVFIGVDLDEAAIRSRLDTCVLSDEEIAIGFEGWAWLHDPLPEWDLGDDPDHADAHRSDPGWR